MMVQCALHVASAQHIVACVPSMVHECCMLHVHLAYQTQLEKFRDDEDSRCKMDGADWVSVFVVSGHGNPSSFASSTSFWSNNAGYSQRVVWRGYNLNS